MQIVHLLVADLLWIAFVLLGARTLPGNPPAPGPYHHTVNMHRRVVVRRVCQALLGFLSLRAGPFGRSHSGRALGQPRRLRLRHVLAPAAEIARKVDAYLRVQERVKVSAAPC